MNRQSQQAFTLLEVMIFTAILSIVLVSTAAFVTRLIYNLKINEHKIYANHYANEVQEWLSSEREVGWNNLSSKSSSSGRTYCLNNNIGNAFTITTLTPAPCPTGTSGYTGINGSSASQPKIYKRELILQTLGTGNTIKAEINVSWYEASVQYSQNVESIYTSY